MIMAYLIFITMILKTQCADYQGSMSPVSTWSVQPDQLALSLITELTRSPMLRGAMPPGRINNMTDIANFNDLDTGQKIKINIAKFSLPTIDFAPNRTWTDADLPDADLPTFSVTDFPFTLPQHPQQQPPPNSSALPFTNEAFLPDAHVNLDDVKADGNKTRTFSVQVTSRT